MADGARERVAALVEHAERAEQITIDTIDDAFGPAYGGTDTTNEAAAFVSDLRALLAASAPVPDAGGGAQCPGCRHSARDHMGEHCHHAKPRRRSMIEPPCDCSYAAAVRDDDEAVVRFYRDLPDPPAAPPVPEAIASVSRDGEGPHRFPGAESAAQGGDFWTSSCAYGCGAWLGGSSSAPADDRRDPRYESAYGDQRGPGTCPENPLPPAAGAGS